MQNYFGPFHFGELKRYNSKCCSYFVILCLQLIFAPFNFAVCLAREIHKIKGTLILIVLQYTSDCFFTYLFMCRWFNLKLDNLTVGFAGYIWDGVRWWQKWTGKMARCVAWASGKTARQKRYHCYALSTSQGFCIRFCLNFCVIINLPLHVKCI